MIKKINIDYIFDCGAEVSVKKTLTFARTIKLKEMKDIVCPLHGKDCLIYMEKERKEFFNELNKGFGKQKNKKFFDELNKSFSEPIEKVKQ